MKNWSWKAILGGVAVDVFGSMLVIVLILIPVGVWLAMRGTRLQDVDTWLITAAPLYSTPGIIFGLGMDAIGGYMAAKWADKNKIAHAAIVGILSLALGLAMGTEKDESLLWSFFVVPAAALGGWWRVKTHGAESKIAPPLDSSSGTPPIAAP